MAWQAGNEVQTAYLLQKVAGLLSFNAMFALMAIVLHFKAAMAILLQFRTCFPHDRQVACFKYAAGYAHRLVR